MRITSIFSFRKKSDQPEIACDSLCHSAPTACDSLCQAPPPTQPIPGHPSLSKPITAEIQFPERAWFLPTQAAWIQDPHPLRIWEKSRQVGATKTDAFDSVMKASPAGAKFDVWVSSRDELQARLYLEDCHEWAKILHLAATDLGLIILDSKNKFSAQVLQFANSRRIYCLSSNPNAFAGKRGHVKIDEFALHADQRLLYKIAKPVTQWGGTFSIISTHRGPGTLFNQIIRGIRQSPDSTPWHLFSYPIQKAIEEGLVERINEKSGRNETPEEFENRIHAECIDEDQWNQEYCCIPADESSAFISHDMISACEDPNLHLLTISQLIASLAAPKHPSEGGSADLYLGVDVGRTKDLCVFDVGEKIGDVIHDRLRLELHNQPFPVMRKEFYRLLELPQIRRCCIDRNGIGMQLAEEAQLKFGCKVEPVHITGPIKEKLAFGLRNAFESLTLKIQADQKLRADLHGIRKQITVTGNIRLDGQTDDSHCDRFWAKALRQEAARPYEEPYAMLG